MDVDKSPDLEQRFYMILSVRDFQETLAFYRDILELPEVHSWHGPDGSGAMLRAETGIVEIVSQPSDREFVPLQGVGMAIQVPDVDARYAALQVRGAALPEAPATHPWGQRSFSLTDPNGVQVVFFSIV